MPVSRSSMGVLSPQPPTQIHAVGDEEASAGVHDHHLPSTLGEGRSQSSAEPRAVSPSAPLISGGGTRGGGELGGSSRGAWRSSSPVVLRPVAAPVTAELVDEGRTRRRSRRWTRSPVARRSLTRSDGPRSEWDGNQDLGDVRGVEVGEAVGAPGSPACRTIQGLAVLVPGHGQRRRDFPTPVPGPAHLHAMASAVVRGCRPGSSRSRLSPGSRRRAPPARSRERSQAPLGRWQHDARQGSAWPCPSRASGRPGP